MAPILDLLSSLPPQTQTHIQSIHTWAKTHLEPLIAHHWEHGTFPPSIFHSFRTHCSHLLGFTIPSQYGGANLDLFTSCLLVSTLASFDASFATSLCVQYGLVSESILLCGTNEQKRRLLPAIASLKTLGCFCLTEPQSGSDASDLTTVAVREGNGYVIRGKKRWIGNAGASEVFVVWARNMSLDGHPIMGFIVQRSQQSQSDAITTRKITGKISMRMIQNFDVEFRDAWCPNENVMHDHVGFAQSVGRVLESTRVYVAWLPVGVSTGALEHAIRYVKERQAFLAPLSSNQLVQEKLARMTAMVSSIHLLAERTTLDYVRGKCYLPAIAMAKAYNSKVGREIVALAREILGGNGIVLDYQIASKFADMESIFTYEGTYDVNMLVCGRAITGVSAFKSGMSVKNEMMAKSKL